MDKSVKRNLILLISLIAYYVLFSYLPFEVWFSERGFQIARLVAFVPAVAVLIVLKHLWHIEIKRPHVQLKYVFLLPLVLFCFINFLSVPIFNFPKSHEAQDAWLLVLELVSDGAAAIFEDLLFVDLFICVFLDTVHVKHAKPLAIFASAFLFCVAHSYIFLYETYPGDVNDAFLVSLLQIIYIFLLVLVCGYLAIYFDSAVIPVTFHFLYNAINHILFYHFYEFDISWPYVLFVSIFAVFGIFYFVALWHLSEERPYRKIEKPRKSGVNETEEK